MGVGGKVAGTWRGSSDLRKGNDERATMRGTLCLGVLKIEEFRMNGVTEGGKKGSEKDQSMHELCLFTQEKGDAARGKKGYGSGEKEVLEAVLRVRGGWGEKIKKKGGTTLGCLGNPVEIHPKGIRWKKSPKK